MTNTPPLVAWLTSTIAGGRVPCPEEIRDAANFRIAGGTQRLCEALSFLAQQSVKGRAA